MPVLHLPFRFPSLDYRSVVLRQEGRLLTAVVLTSRHTPISKWKEVKEQLIFYFNSHESKTLKHMTKFKLRLDSSTGNLQQLLKSNFYFIPFNTYVKIRFMVLLFLYNIALQSILCIHCIVVCNIYLFWLHCMGQQQPPHYNSFVKMLPDKLSLGGHSLGSFAVDLQV